MPTKNKPSSKPDAPAAAPVAGSSASSFSVDEIKGLIELVAEKGFTEFELEHGPFRLRIGTEKAGTSQVINYSSAPVQMMPSMPMPMMAPPVAMPSAAAVAAPIAAPAGAAAPVPAADNAAEAGWKKVTSPMVGTFYRSPSPSSPPFASAGDKVNDNSVLCIIEAMKLMNEIKAEMSGTVRKVCVENGQPVEYGQVLFLIEPA